MRPHLIPRARGALVAVAIVATATAAIGHDPVAAPSPEPVGRIVDAFRISGKAKGLYPGGTRKMRVRVGNPHPFPIVVKRVRVTRRGGAAGCPGTAVGVRPFRGSRRVAPGRTAAIRMKIRLAAGAPDACQGVTFRLTFSGKAVRG